MLVLGIESSSPIASVALVSEEKLWGEITLNIGLTHSEQLLPLIDLLLRQARVKLADLAGIAVSSGPGSFTGLRIGMATAKGLAQGLQIPLCGIPTLLALAFLAEGQQGLVVPLLNARRDEVYTALYRFYGKEYEELEPFQAIRPQLWAEKLKTYQEKVFLTGDGVLPYQAIWQEVLGEKALLPTPILQVARAVSVAWLAQARLQQGQADDLFNLTPLYIRTSSAERKLAKG